MWNIWGNNKNQQDSMRINGESMGNQWWNQWGINGESMITYWESMGNQCRINGESMGIQ